jgi:hypothetical protein
MISRSVFLRMRNVSDKIFIENQNTHSMFSKFFFRKSRRLWDNVGKCGTVRQAIDEDTTRRMHVACWIHKATNSHSEYVIIIAVARQKSLRESASILRLYVQCLACYYFIIRAMAWTAAVGHIWSEPRITDRVTIATRMLTVPIQKHGNSLQSCGVVSKNNLYVLLNNQKDA